MEQLFIKASRAKLRFNMAGRLINTEDLWSLSVNVLDQMLVELDSANVEKRKSFLQSNDAVLDAKQATAQLAFEVAKYVFDTKVLEANEKDAVKKREAELSTLKDLLEAKKLQALDNLSEEELSRRIAELSK